MLVERPNFEGIVDRGTAVKFPVLPNTEIAGDGRRDQVYVIIKLPGPYNN